MKIFPIRFQWWCLFLCFCIIFLAIFNTKLEDSSPDAIRSIFSSEVLALHSLIRETAKEPWYVTIIYFRVKPFFIIALVIGHTFYRGKMIFNIFFPFQTNKQFCQKIPTKFKRIETIPINKNKSTEQTSYTMIHKKFHTQVEFQ